jgi:hypothetical protein
MNRPTRGKLYERRREVANYALKGWTPAAIARHMHIPPATVSRDLAAMREFWREFPVYDFDRARLEQLQKIDLVEAEAWAAWQRSQEPQRSAWLTHGKAGEQSRSSLKHQHGDPRYLREIARCVAQRYEMIGVQPPEAPRPEVVGTPLPIDQYPLVFKHYLLLRKFYGDPPYAEFGGLTAEQIAALVAEHERAPYQDHRDQGPEERK